MSCAKKAAANDAVGCKTARACDSCVKKRARWYCAADDAFLCQACDHSVHSANSLARRHDRVRLKTASHKEYPHATPAWHQGFTRKARTPRGGTKGKLRREGTLFPVVPELGGDETTSIEETGDEQLLYTVPIADDLFTASGSSEGVRRVAISESCGVDFDGGLGLHGFLPTEMDLEEFSADVESLLGRGLENECDFGIEGLGFLDCEEKGFAGFDGRVKVEDEDEVEQEAKDANSMSCWAETSMEIDMMRPEPLELNFDDYDESPASCGDEDDDRKVHILSPGTAETLASNIMHKNCEEDSKKSKKKKKKRKILLRLNYGAVMTEWASQGSPWTTGDRPEFDLDATWPNCMDTIDAPMLQHNHHQQHYMGLSGGNSTVLADGGREARMSRYREKRRNRWFSKKIRYEVRKLNAEKRPRMKGRFVKQASFTTPK